MREAGVSRLDSGALIQRYLRHFFGMFMAALKVRGHRLGRDGATSWSFNSNMLYWTTADIANILRGRRFL